MSERGRGGWRSACLFFLRSREPSGPQSPRAHPKTVACTRHQVSTVIRVPEELNIGDGSEVYPLGERPVGYIAEGQRWSMRRTALLVG
jgi:hypothetical protein